MKVKFQFNSKSSGASVPQAKYIAKQCGGFVEDNIYLFT